MHGQNDMRNMETIYSVLIYIWSVCPVLVNVQTNIMTKWAILIFFFKLTYLPLAPLEIIFEFGTLTPYLCIHSLHKNLKNELNGMCVTNILNAQIISFFQNLISANKLHVCVHILVYEIRFHYLIYYNLLNLLALSPSLL